MSKLAHITVKHRGDVACFVPEDLALHLNDDCVIELDRAEEYGKVKDIELSSREMEREKRASRVLRCATLQDHAKQDENELMAKMALDSFRTRAETMDLRLRPLHAHYSFQRDRLTFSFSSEDQLDLRKLVHELQCELDTRIEMRQVGVRDEAGIIGGMGPCGRCLCCSTWLHHFRSVNVRMAKAQDLSLNPSSISGMCGRLKCCLRYEYDTYREMGRDMPRVGSRIEWAEGDGVVIGRDVLGQRLSVRMPDHRVVRVAMDDVTLIHPPEPRGERDDDRKQPTQRFRDRGPRPRGARGDRRDTRAHGRGTHPRQGGGERSGGRDGAPTGGRDPKQSQSSGEQHEDQHRQRPQSEPPGNA